MKSFFYTVSERSRAGNQTATIYRIKRNRPVCLGYTNCNTANYAGMIPEVVEFLIKNKQVTRRNRYDIADTYHLEQI